jgi:hypothetical protein
MKKNISFILAVFLLFGAATLWTGCAAEPKLEPVVTLGVPENEKLAETIQIDDFIFNIYSSYAELIGYEGGDTDIIIPDEAAGKVVLKIGEKAFWGNKTLKSIKLPENLRYIDRYAFQKCTELNTVEFNQRLETIDDYAFAQTALAELNFPVSLASIGKYSFSECVGFKSLTIPSRVNSIGKYAFYGCTTLESIAFNERLDKLSDRMFYNCSSLKTVEIPKNITEIGGYVFAGCSSLETIFIPAEVTKVGEGQFHGSPGVTVLTSAGSAAAKFCEKNGVKWREPDAKQ